MTTSPPPLHLLESFLTDSFKPLQRGGESPQRVLPARLDHQSCLWFLDVGHLGRRQGGERDGALLGRGEFEDLEQLT